MMCVRLDGGMNNEADALNGLLDLGKGCRSSDARTDTTFRGNVQYLGFLDQPPSSQLSQVLWITTSLA
jgi:hypothetical protein